MKKLYRRRAFACAVRRRRHERQVRGRGLLEAAAWLEEAAALHVRGSEVHGWLMGAADFMRQRAEELGVIVWYRSWETYGG